MRSQCLALAVIFSAGTDTFLLFNNPAFSMALRFSALLSLGAPTVRRECITGKLQGKGVYKNECPLPECKKPVWRNDLTSNTTIANIVGAYKNMQRVKKQENCQKPPGIVDLTGHQNSLVEWFVVFMKSALPYVGGRRATNGGADFGGT